MKLERFRENNPQKKVLFFLLVISVFLFAGVFFYTSFAVYEDVKTFNILSGNIPDIGEALYVYHLEDGRVSTLASNVEGLRLDESRSSCNYGVVPKWVNGAISLDKTSATNTSTQKIRCELFMVEPPANKTLKVLAKLNPSYAYTRNDAKCLNVLEDGSIENPDSLMSNEEEPILCGMDDDYGTSYYLRGNHTNNNVKFGGYCWKLVRVTGTGGLKLIYNGDLDSNGKCTTTSGNHKGFAAQLLDLSGSKLYGSSYTQEGNTYTLSETSTMDFSTDSASILGKYTCGNTSSTCSTLYMVLTNYDSVNAYVLKIDQNMNYAQIGTSSFNYFDDSTSSSSTTEMGTLAFNGYMWKNYYSIYQLNQRYTGTLLDATKVSNWEYYYGDSISYNSEEGYYYITNQDGSNVETLNWEDNYEDNLIGKYTCKGVNRWDEKSFRCQKAYHVIETESYGGLMVSEVLTNGRLATGDIKMSTSYTFDGTNYTLTNPVTISSYDWYYDFRDYQNYYHCGSWNSTSCTKIYKTITTSKISFSSISSGNNYYFGSSFTYTEGEEKPYTLNNASQVWDMTEANNKEFLNTHHYTCFRISDNQCENMYYVISLSNNVYYLLILNGNENGMDAINKMVGNNDVNAYNSEIKASIDWWYEQNIKNTAYESKLEDAIYCNDRSISKYGGWSENGVLDSFNANSKLLFNYGNSKYYLKCPNKRDAFTVSDSTYGNGALTYPIGLLNNTEAILNGNLTMRMSGDRYWIFGASSASYTGAYNRAIGTDGKFGDYSPRGFFGVRPVLSLKFGTLFESGGDGSANNPFVVDMSS